MGDLVPKRFVSLLLLFTIRLNNASLCFANLSFGAGLGVFVVNLELPVHYRLMRDLPGFLAGLATWSVTMTSL